MYVRGAIVIRKRRRTVVKVSAGCAPCGCVTDYTKLNERIANG
jgi:hypothetical protein